MNMMQLLLNKFDVQNNKFGELKIDINAVNVRCESNFNVLNEKLSNSLKSMDDRIDEIESRITEKVDKQMHDITENFESQINECKANTMSQIEEINKNIQRCETDTDSKISEINTNYKTEIQLLHDTVKTINQNSVQSKYENNSKFTLIEQNINSVKDELSGEINKKLTGLTERILITRDINNEIELESFSSKSRTCLLYTSCITSCNLAGSV